MKIAVLYSPFDKLANKEVEQDLKDMGLSVHGALRKAGFEPLLIDIDKVGFQGISELRPDVVFNVCERLHGDSTYEPQIASLLEMTGLKITGSSGATLSVCNNKIMTKAMAQRHDILTPKHEIFFNRDQPFKGDLSYPVLVKPAAMHNSIGIFKDSLAYTEEDMRKKIARVLYQYRQPVLVEEYIPGKDIEATIIGNNGSAKVLPLVEVYYPKLKDQSQQFFSYESKWSKGKQESGYYRAAENLDPNLNKELIALAKKYYKLFNIRDYGRIDFRIGENGKIYLLEATANPGLSNGDSTIVAAEAHGMQHESFILNIFLTASIRYGIMNKQEASELLTGYMPLRNS
jgi:D-alanine-D-alanine ligase